MSASLIKTVEAKYLKEGIPDFRAGDTVRVHLKFVEGGKEKTQPFEGIVIRKRGEGLGATFTVRRVTHGVGVERTFPLHAPYIVKIDVLRYGRVRRARLYYLRERRGRAARIKEDRHRASS